MITVRTEFSDHENDFPITRKLQYCRNLVFVIGPVIRSGLRSRKCTYGYIRSCAEYGPIIGCSERGLSNSRIQVEYTFYP